MVKQKKNLRQSVMIRVYACLPYAYSKKPEVLGLVEYFLKKLPCILYSSIKCSVLFSELLCSVVQEDPTSYITC